MAYADTRRKQTNNTKEKLKNACPVGALQETLSNLTVKPTVSVKGSQSIQREHSLVTANRYSRYSRTTPPSTSKTSHKSPNLNPRGRQSVQREPSDERQNTRKAVITKSKGILAPKGYTVRSIIPAAQAELLPVARAMHGDQFATRVKKLFDPEREAAIIAIETGVYVGWRVPGSTFDCIRVGSNSKCFCGHLLSDHAPHTGKSVQVPCTLERCECKAFAFILSRPEEAGEWWLQRRPGYDPSTWRAKCKCKHTHEDHRPNGLRRCRIRGCGCTKFFSNFLCCACDRHWEEHETSFDTEATRKEQGLPFGEAYLPFHEFPELRDAILTGR